MNGPKGKNGPIDFCPMCGKDVTEITWDAELDVCTCGNCGWTNGSENLDLYPTDPGPKTPMTNAQRIRAMTDEELADWLEAWCRDAESCYDCPMDVCPIEESVSWLNWLQQPVKEGAE